MTYERAKQILLTAKATAPKINAYKKRIAKCDTRIEAHQKLIASYGTFRVKGGKRINTIEDAVIKAESDKAYYQQQIDKLMVVIKRADIIILAMPKKWWKCARLYYLKGYTVREICKVKHFASRTAVYKQLNHLDDYMKEYFKSEE